MLAVLARRENIDLEIKNVDLELMRQMILRSTYVRYYGSLEYCDFRISDKHFAGLNELFKTYPYAVLMTLLATAGDNIAQDCLQDTSIDTIIDKHNTATNIGLSPLFAELRQYCVEAPYCHYYQRF